MNNSVNSPANSGSGAWLFRAALLIGGAIAIYFVYKALFRGEVKRLTLVKDIHSAKTDVGKPFLFDRSVLPPFYEGGEYSVSFWVYVNDWNYKLNTPKDLLTIANTSSPNGIVSLGLYLDARENNMHLVTSTVAGEAPTQGSQGAAFTDNGVLTWDTYNSLMSAQGGLGVNLKNKYTVGPIDLQRWVHVIVAMNGKTIDIYLNGKLARSCVLSSIYKVDAAGYNISVANHTGFGGFVSGVSASDYAINPEQAHRMYQAGPLGDIGVLGYLQSFFDPKAIGTLDAPKTNAN